MLPHKKEDTCGYVDEDTCGYVDIYHYLFDGCLYKAKTFSKSISEICTKIKIGLFGQTNKH